MHESMIQKDTQVKYTGYRIQGDTGFNYIIYRTQRDTGIKDIGVNDTGAAYRGIQDSKIRGLQELRVHDKGGYIG